jgi:hypothetical protein
VGVPPVLGEGEVSYRIRFTLPDGRTGIVTRQFNSREEAQKAIDRGQHDDALRYRTNAASLSYTVEEVVATAAVPDATPEPSTPEARIRELEAELAQLRDAYDAAVRDYDAARRNVAGYKAVLAALRQGPAKASEAPGDTP